MAPAADELVLLSLIVLVMDPQSNATMPFEVASGRVTVDFAIFRVAHPKGPIPEDVSVAG
jgi:hypothetical protein